MKSTAQNRKRGRPLSKTEGAAEAFDFIEKYISSNNLTKNSLAISLGMTPSTVGRALNDRATARWSPTFSAIYSTALKTRGAFDSDPAVQRLAAYEGPGKAVIQRILSDVDELVTTLSTVAK